MNAKKIKSYSSKNDRIKSCSWKPEILNDIRRRPLCDGPAPVHGSLATTPQREKFNNLHYLHFIYYMILKEVVFSKTAGFSQSHLTMTQSLNVSSSQLSNFWSYYHQVSKQSSNCENNSSPDKMYVNNSYLRLLLRIAETNLNIFVCFLWLC